MLECSIKAENCKFLFILFSSRLPDCCKLKIGDFLLFKIFLIIPSSAQMVPLRTNTMSNMQLIMMCLLGFLHVFAIICMNNNHQNIGSPFEIKSQNIRCYNYIGILTNFHQPIITFCLIIMWSKNKMTLL